MHIFNRIKKLKEQNKNISQISEELNLDWKTVKKYFEQKDPPILKERKHRTRLDPLDGFYDRLDSLTKIESLKTSDIFTDLKLNGCLASYDTVRRYLLKKFEGQIKKERFFEQEYEPGYELQVDFKEDVEIILNNNKILVHLFYSILPFSKKVFVKSFKGLNFECFADGLASSFEYFGGIPTRVRQDNLKPCVNTILKGRSRKYTEKYIKFIEYYGYEVSPCNPAKGNEKGHVERSIQTYTNQLKSRLKIESISFENLNEFNIWLLQTIEKLQTHVSDKFDEEKRSLINTRVRNYEVETFTDILSVSKYGTVRINKAVYSVPDGYVESLVRAVITSTEIQIFNMQNAHLIASHPRLKDQQQSIKLEHVVSSLVQKPGALIHWKHRSIIFEDKILLQFYEKLKKQDHYNAEKQLLQVLNLIQHTTLNEIKASIELWLENPKESVFNFIRYLTLEESRPTQNIEQEKIKPNLNEYDKILKGEHLNAYPH